MAQLLDVILGLIVLHGGLNIPGTDGIGGNGVGGKFYCDILRQVNHSGFGWGVSRTMTSTKSKHRRDIDDPPGPRFLKIRDGELSSEKQSPQVDSDNPVPLSHREPLAAA